MAIGGRARKNRIAARRWSCWCNTGFAEMPRGRRLLTNAEVDEIRLMFAGGSTVTEVARAFERSVRTVGMIVGTRRLQLDSIKPRPATGQALQGMNGYGIKEL